MRGSKVPSMATECWSRKMACRTLGQASSTLYVPRVHERVPSRTPTSSPRAPSRTSPPSLSFSRAHVRTREGTGRRLAGTHPPTEPPLPKAPVSAAVRAAEVAADVALAATHFSSGCGLLREVCGGQRDVRRHFRCPYGGADGSLRQRWLRGGWVPANLRPVPSRVRTCAREKEREGGEVRDGARGEEVGVRDGTRSWTRGTYRVEAACPRLPAGDLSAPAFGRDG